MVVAKHLFLSHGGTMIRVCPKRDAICPHGLACPYSIDRYECKPEPLKGDAAALAKQEPKT